ncbi:sushi, von Willebrand factor type A, EGF and pentraxin domain-containing protein 1-like isoform X2 [Varroa destructor]|uniref:Uncharacterized protein n=1 Tax=Varroa destructor TaxID=109461 RepID=A0A7M7J8I7_VARDE|nr:sushi, von Willebrand factor type A, EGF and pentraxin domain-containing protein 1-like isoform X2 [Varroa destructor]
MGGSSALFLLGVLALLAKVASSKAAPSGTSAELYKLYQDSSSRDQSPLPAGHFDADVWEFSEELQADETDNDNSDKFRQRCLSGKCNLSSLDSLTNGDDNEDQREGCPQNREEAAALGRSCLRKCKSDEDCISSKKKCLCDGLCGWSCVRPDLNCDELEPIPNGNFKVTGDYFGARVYYECAEDYWMSGPKERMCQGDGKWSDKLPECKKQPACSEPPRVPHSRINTTSEDANDFPINSTIRYSCFPGYEARGFDIAKCIFYNNSAQWFGPDLKCEPINCAAPEKIDNGKIVGSSTKFTSSIKYECHEGYELIGRAHRYCTSGATWSGTAPECRPVVCPKPTNPDNGRAIFTSLTYGSTVTYECHHGFTIKGPPSARCNAKREWHGGPSTCVEINCQSPGVLYNGFVELRSTNLNAKATFHCHNGMKFEGDSTFAICMETANWSHPLPRCLAPCKTPTVENGRVVSLAPSSLLEHGQSLNVTCTENHELSSNLSQLLQQQQQPICNNGTWTHLPRCVPARCKDLPPRPANGIVIAPKTEHGMKALFQCDDGFDLLGPNTTTCHFGNWTNPTPLCKEVYCPYPGAIEHGRVLLVGNMGMYDYRPYVRRVRNNRQITFECKRGYVLEHNAPAGATCVDGIWSPTQLPHCVPGSHPPVRQVRSVAEQPETLMGDAELRERLRQHRAGIREALVVMAKRVRHRRHRRKSGRCRSPIAEDLIGVGEIREVTAEGFPHGATIRVACLTGYESATANGTARCVEGRWQPKEPFCRPLSCLLPRKLHMAFRDIDNEREAAPGARIEHDGIVAVGCTPGHTLEGQHDLQCSFGLWDAAVFPECVPEPCELPVLENGYYLGGLRAGESLSHGSSVEFDCEIEFLKNSPSKPIKCSEGQLVPGPPVCLHLGDLGREELLRRREWAAAAARGTGDISGRRSCSTPERIHQSLVFPSEQNLEKTAKDSLVKTELSSPTESPYLAPSDSDYVGTLQFPHGTEVVFDCIEASPGGERNTWKLLCDDGNWIGRPEKCDLGNSAVPKELRANMSCYYQPSEQHLLAFDGDLPLATDEVHEFTPGSLLTFRCADIGKYALIGSGSRTCEYGEWTGVKSSCIGLSQEHDYALEKPPTILFRHSMGPVAQSTDGKLIVWEGTILHLECLWLRKYGTPKWEISHQNRRYAEGWTTEPGRDSQLEYRLSIYHAREDDSGRYTCVTPMGHKHTVEIVVKSVTCPSLFNGSNESPPLASSGFSTVGTLLVSQNDTRMGAVVAFSCPEGQNLAGEAEIECLPSGRWSSDVPYCKVAVPCTVTECRDLSKLDSDLLIIDVLSNAVGAKATFSCPQGYGLRGEFEAECLESGFWSADIPHCQSVSCQPLEPPEDGYILGAGPETGTGEARVFRGGDLIQFSCNADFMMIGTGIVVCQENERWSAPVPKCVPACQYPPMGESGARIVSRVSYFYRINETVTFECPQGKVLRGAGIIKCVSKGHWSAPVPRCLDAQSHSAFSASQGQQSTLSMLQPTPGGQPISDGTSEVNSRIAKKP